MFKKIMVTGGTGNVGRPTVGSLIDRDMDPNRIVLAVRDIDRAKQSFDPDFEYRNFDFEDEKTIEGSLDDIKKLLLIRPPAISDVEKYIFPVVDEAEKAGVDRIVFLSLMGVENNPFVPHHDIEKYIESSNVNHTFLRPSFFMQNLTTTHLEEIRDRDQIFAPAGNGRTNFIDTRDIGEVGAVVLTEDGHENRAYELTGRDSLTYNEIAKIMSEILDKKIEYVSPSILHFLIRKNDEGIELGKILVMIGLYTAARLGRADESTNTVKEILGREPTSFEEFVKDHRDIWKR